MLCFKLSYCFKACEGSSRTKPYQFVTKYHIQTPGLTVMNNKKTQSLVIAKSLAYTTLFISSVITKTYAAGTPQLGSIYNPAEQFETAMTLIDGKYTSPDFETGLKWLKLSAAQQHPDALNQLGLYYEWGVDNLEKDYLKAYDLYLQAAKRGNRNAQFNLSALLMRKNTSLHNTEQGIYWLEQAAENEDSDAQYSLAQYLIKSEKHDADTHHKIVYWLKRAADNGNKTSQYTLAVSYLKGIYTELNLEKAYYWFHEAAKKGDAASQFNVALMLDQGEGVKADADKAIEWYKKAAEQNEHGAQFNLGAKYLFGIGIEQDIKKGISLIERAANQGNPAAQTLLGNLLKQGEHIKKDYRRAYNLYLAAAENGYAEAQYQLALLFATGQGVIKSNAQSVHWIRQAALSNHPMAQYGLGAYLANGVGIEKNLPEAAYWLSMAAAQGQQHAIESRNSVLEQLSTEQLSTLRLRISQSLPTGL